MWGGGRGGDGMRARGGGGLGCKVGRYCVSGVWFQLAGVVCFGSAGNRPIKGSIAIQIPNIVINDSTKSSSYCSGGVRE